ncbi:MAG: ThuA domain-containing protein, partial [Planctomycetota bacterium]
MLQFVRGMCGFRCSASLSRTLPLLAIVVTIATFVLSWPAAVSAAPKKVVLIAGKKSHGPEGNGIHDYPWSVKLLKLMLDNSNVREQVDVEFHLNGWPQDDRCLDTAATIMVISDGRDGDLYEEAPHLSTKEHRARIQKQIDRGCGFATFHFSTTLDAPVELPTADHPVCRGVRPFQMKEEFYYNLRFHPGDTALKPLLRVPALAGREPDGRVVAWARERRDGGRGFGTTCGHFYDNWRHADFRKFILNAICWTAQVEVPAEGVQARYYDRDEITQALSKLNEQGRAIGEPAIRVLMFAGNAAHEWHNWRRTTPAIVTALERDPRIQVDVSLDIEDLARRRLSDYQVILQNYVNWHDPRPLSDEARRAFTEFLRSGGGLVLVHFANGAFNFSLPMATASDWPEYRRMVRRVWNHQGKGEAQSGHDAFGKFQVALTAVKHPLTTGLGGFEVTDELYFRQDGEEPIEPLLTARSKVTGRDEPLAWTYRYGEGRVFQTLLGHSEQTYQTFEPREMLRRAVAYCAQREIKPLEPAQDPAIGVAANTPAAKPGAPNPAGNTTAGSPAATKLVLVDGKFAQALDVARSPVMIEGRDEYRVPPLTVDCWARLKQRAGYNILLAQELKSSATHWELFTMPESGHFTVYLPGHRPDHVRSTVDIADDRWHHVAMVYEANRIRLYVDGKMAADQPIEFLKGQTVAGGVGIGQLVGKEIGCHGLIDEVRISRGVRTFETRPTEAPVVDDNTIGLWHCDRVPDKQLPKEPNKEPKVEWLIDESKQQNHGQLGAADPGVNKGNGKGAVARREDHWGMEAVGFNWTEQDSVDNRWNQTDVGSFLASTVPLAGLLPVRKGLSIRVGEGEQGTMCYDTARMQLRAAWQNGFLQFHPARFGLINSPAPKGEMQWMVPEGPGWMGGTVRYRGLQPQGQRVLLQYEVGTTAVSELPGLRKVAAGSVFLRPLALGAAKEELRLRLGPVQGGKESRQLAADVVLVERADKTLITCVVGNDLPRWDTAADGRLDLVFAPQGTSRTCLVQQIVIPTPPDDAARKSLDAIVQELRRGKPESIEAFARPGAARWTAEITTQGRRGKDTDGPYVIDTITLPYENPYRALFFVGGHDFYSNGDIALCTVHGDVWRVSGVQEKLERLVWKRVATGMFQPLGLKIAAVKRSDGSQEKDIVHVLGRDQITRLYDRNADGEADYYECFSNDYETSPGGHDYVTCLETDSRGNFYFTHALHGIVRLDAEGKSLGS